MNLELSRNLYELVKTQKEYILADSFMHKIRAINHIIPDFMLHVFEFAQIIDDINQDPKHEKMPIYFKNYEIVLKDIATLPEVQRAKIQECVDSIPIKE